MSTVYLVPPSNVKLMTADDIADTAEELCAHQRNVGKVCGDGCPLFNKYGDCCGLPQRAALNAIFDFAEKGGSE